MNSSFFRIWAKIILAVPRHAENAPVPSPLGDFHKNPDIFNLFEGDTIFSLFEGDTAIAAPTSGLRTLGLLLLYFTILSLEPAYPPGSIFIILVFVSDKIFPPTSSLRLKFYLFACNAYNLCLNYSALFSYYY